MFRNPFKKKENRNIYWYPLGVSLSGGTNTQGNTGSLPQIRKGLQLYRDLLLCTPLVVKDKTDKIIDSPLLNLINKPNSFQTKAELLSLLVEDYFLNGNFIAYIKSNNEGRILSIAPFLAGSIYCYADSQQAGNRNANNSDPTFLDTPNSHYYLYTFSVGKGEDGKEKKQTRRISPEDVLHLRSPWNNRGDFLNGQGIFTSYFESLSMAEETIKAGQRISQNNLLPQSLLSGIEANNEDESDELENSLNMFQSDKRMFLTLPEGVEIKPMTFARPEVFFQILSSVSSLNIARIMNIPIDLISREDGGNQNMGIGLRESFRYWTKTSGFAFLKMVSDKFSELLPEGQRFSFLTRGTQASDLRELSMSLKQMTEDGILSPEKAQEWVADL